MATTTDTQQRALMSLHTAELMANDLAEVAAEWGQIDDGERESWSLDWGNEMAGLPRLARCVAEGVLDAEQAARYRTLLSKLEELMPLIERLNLRPPPVSWDA